MLSNLPKVTQADDVEARIPDQAVWPQACTPGHGNKQPLKGEKTWTLESCPISKMKITIIFPL